MKKNGPYYGKPWSGKHPLTPHALGRMMRNARQEQSVNLFALAHRLEISSTTILHWESGRKWPSIHMLDLYSRAIGTELKDLIP